MKKYFYLFALVLLPMMFISCGDDEENITPQNQENGNPDNPDTPTIGGIVVEVDENGKAKDGHHFKKIDDSNFYIDDIKYTASQGNLVVSGYDQDYFSGEANIIAALKYDGRTINVRGIKKDAFRGGTVLTSLLIPNSVTWIGEWAFRYCSILKSITCFATTPPSADDAFFDFDFSSATLHVPAESIDDYKGKSPWSSFGSIVAIE